MAAERRRSETKKPFLSTSKGRRGNYDFIRRQEDSFGGKTKFGRTKPKNSIFSKRRENKSRMQRVIGKAVGRIAAGLADRACKGT